ncbi:hypothetical protein TMEN_5426 [Trichophyton mentagrophytes]|nr:hypothetical protein TMEN_5426 [Trichophyton mentagrophytes]
MQLSDCPMTPVKVRGKKRHGKDVSQGTREKRPRQTSTRASTNYTHYSHVHPEGTVVKPKLRTQSAIASRISLQSLPMEILQQIFFDCLEINLLRVFPQLACAMSSERIYSCITMLAIWEEPSPICHTPESMDEQAGIRSERTEGKILRAFRPVGYRYLSTVEKARLQSQILNCRWATLELISSCVVKCAGLGQLLETHDDNLQMHEPDLISILNSRENTLLRSYAEISSYRNNLSLWWSLNFHFKGNFDPPVIFRNVARVFSIPEKAIDKRPWSPRKVELFKLFRLLLHQGTSPAPSQPYSREVLHAGVHQAIVENNPSMVERLLELDEYCVNSDAFPFNGRPKYADYDIPSEHFLTAIRHSTTLDMMKTLVRASAESLPFDNSEITEWALEREKSSSPFCEWLLELMVQLPYQKSHFPEPMFFCGMLNHAGYCWSLPLVRPQRLRYVTDNPAYRSYVAAWSEEPYPWPADLFSYTDEAPIDLSVLQHSKS